MKRSSEKTFGLVFSLIFLLFSFWPILNGNSIRTLPLVLSIFLLALSFIKPQLLKPFNLLWMKLGETLGKVISPIIMLIIFFIVITPIGLILKIFKKDLLGLNFLNTNTYWIKRKTKITTMDKQF